MKKIILCILDGFGYREEEYGNAISKAYKPNYNYLWKHYPHSLLDASGEAVGLPKGQMGNSEVGHTNIGAGRVVYQPLERINKSIEDGSLYENSELLDVINFTKQNNSKLHIYGLLSDGGVHSHINHILAILDMCKKYECNNVYLHMFTDGRDTLPSSALEYFKILEEKINELGIGKIATISGRYYAMDRDKRWERVQKAYDAIVNAIGEENDTYEEVLDSNYLRDITDEFIVPAVLTKEGVLNDGDGIIFANFRPDRATELLMAITNPAVKEMNTKDFTNIKLVTLMPTVSSVIGKPAFKEEKLDNTLGVYLSDMSYTQLRIAETEKYAHVTYFFDGGIDKELYGAKKILIPSPKEVATYDLKPEMSAIEVTDTLIEEMKNDYSLIVLNFANPDMVAHTGNIEKTVEALETVDDCLGRVYKKATLYEYTLIVTADHGNAEIMLDEEGNMVTSHTTSKVPFIIVDENVTVRDGKLGDIAPTILKLMNMDIPKEMTGNVLI